MAKIITINAAFAECIDTLQYYINSATPYLLDNKTVIDEYYLEEVTSSKVLALLSSNDINNCKFGTDYCENGDSGVLYITRHLTEEEKQSKILTKKAGIKYCTKKLIKWSNRSEEHKAQIQNYLDHKGITL